jgi:amino acid adenylation domain-containing protein/thioester reductase-like protein
VGGDTLKGVTPQSYTVVNEYGPTECTVTATRFTINQADYASIPIGRPLANTQAYVVNPQGQLQPMGVPGELWLGGAQVARGYWNRPELTAEKFIANPFTDGDHNARVYRTGDIVRWLPDGNLEFIGRRDFQIKIRGFRVELGEIDHALIQHPAVHDAIVIAREDPSGGHYLCGYYVSAPPVEPAEIKAFLGRDLPGYMIPAFLIPLPALPINAHGKVDRKALPDPHQGAQRPYLAPRNEIEEQIAGIWREILHPERSLSLDDDFFALGGNSLKVMALAARLEKAFGVKLALADLFNRPILQDLAADITQRTRRQRYTPIAPVPESDHYLTSAVQKRMYVLQSLPGIGATYNIPQTLLLEGSLDSARLADTLDRLVDRHEILRTRFTLIDGDIVQQIQPHLRYKKLFKEVPEADLAEALNEFCQPFDLSEAPLFRMGLFKLAPERHLLIIDMHHSISDGASSLILFDELFTLYEGGVLPPMPIQYRDFAAWQNELLDSTAMQTHEAYWLTTLAGELPVLQLPTDRPRPAHQQFAGASVEFALDEALMAQLNEIAQRAGSTLFMTMLAAYQVLLGKYAGQEDLIIGTVASGRTHPDAENLIGMFVTTLPIRGLPQADKPFSRFLHEVRQAVLDALEHQDYPFERIVENLHLPRDPSRNPLFTASFGLLAAESIQQAAQLTIRHYPTASTSSHFDLSLDIGVQTDRIDGYFNYATHLFDAATIQRMAGHFVRLLQQIAADPEIRLGNIELMSAEERQHLLVDFNATALPVPTDRTFPELFAEQAAKTPDRLALVYRDERYTYQQLDAKTNALARALRDRGVQPDAIVPILLHRSAEMLIAALAIMKAGGAYLPVDPEYPQTRIDFMLADSGATLLLSEAALREKVGVFAGAWLEVHDPALYAGPATPWEPLARPEHLAYVIYTSGSTGQPKGVLIEQRNLVNLCAGENAANATTAEDAVANHYSFSFDSAVSCLFPPLLVGAVVHLVPDELRLAPDTLSAYFEDQGITIADFPTQFGEQFMQLTRNQSLRLLLVGGERLKTATPQPYTLINAYGPTECTVTATRFTLERADDVNIPIGRPVANTQAYVVNARGQLQPIGIPGELWLGGAQVARGYWNRPELTAEKFIANPFDAHRPEGKGPGVRGVSRVYRTGDIVRWRPDGTLEFSARQDHQVKIRGFRVELGEVEQAILSLPAVRETVVVALDDDSGNKYLAGYLVAEPPTVELDFPTLRQTLHNTLPDYLIPAHFIQLDHLPLTVNGKIDTRALPKPGTATEEIVRGYTAPRNELEQTLATVWATVLRIKNVGIHDNFFALGGNSLQAITVIARLQKHFVVTINDLYQWQTIAELAPKIKPRQDYLNLFLNDLKENPEAWADPLAAHPEYQAQLATAQQQYRATWARYQDLDFTAQRRYSHLLLTGATGFLGAYLLYDLLRQPEDTPLVVIIRGTDRADATARLRSKFAYYFGDTTWDAFGIEDRITVLCGDLSQPQFGLTTADYQHWAQQIDGILNSAANVRHYGHYQEFYQANVQSVVNLIDFAQTGIPKDLHHISTLSVAAGVFPDREYVVFTEDAADEGQVSSNHYLTTKLAAEKLLIDRRAQGLNASIYRVGNIVFSQDTGRYQENIEDNAFFSQVQSFVNLGVTPAMKDDIDFTYVDSLAQAILRLMHTAPLRNETYHLANPRRLKLSQVLTDPALGLAVRTVPFADFVDTLLNHLEQWGFSHHIENILTHMGWLGGELEQQTLVTSLADRTEFLLERLGFRWPTLIRPNLLPMIRQALAERIAFMAQTPLFAQLSVEQRATLAGQATLTAFRNERPLLWEGDPTDALYLVMDGHLEISSTSTSGWTGTLGILSAKDFVGEESLFPGKCAILTAEALLGDVVVLQFPGAVLRATIQQHPQLALNLLEVLETRLQRLARLVISIS